MELVILLCMKLAATECEDKHINMFTASQLQCESSAIMTMAKKIDTNNWKIINWRCVQNVF